MNYYKLLWIMPMALLIVAILLPMPYYYYQIVKWIMCGICIFVCFSLWDNSNAIKDKDKNKWRLCLFIALGSIIILYNPFVPFHFTKEIWIGINSFTIISFIGYLFFIKT